MFFLGRLKINYMFIFQENLCLKNSVCCLYINSANKLLLGFLLTAFFVKNPISSLIISHGYTNYKNFKFCHKQSKIKKRFSHYCMKCNIPVLASHFDLSFSSCRLVTYVCRYQDLTRMSTNTDTIYFLILST